MVERCGCVMILSGLPRPVPWSSGRGNWYFLPSCTSGASRFHTSRQMSMISRVRWMGASYGTPWNPSITCGPDAPRPRMQRPPDRSSIPAAVIAMSVGVRV